MDLRRAYSDDLLIHTLYLYPNTFSLFFYFLFFSSFLQ